MVSVTLSIPIEIREKMKKHDEINWSAFIRKCITEKAKEISWKEKMLKQLQKEKDITNWSVSLSQKAKKGRFQELKDKSLI